MKDNRDDQQHAQWLLLLASNLKQAIQTRLLDLIELQEKLTPLVGTTCTGKPHWRDSNSQGKAAKLYINHGANVACPLHGLPEPGKRTRTYVGTKPDKIAAALAAVERETMRRKLEANLRTLHSDLRDTGHYLTNCYSALNYTSPLCGNDQQPRPLESP